MSHSGKQLILSQINQQSSLSGLVSHVSNSSIKDKIIRTNETCGSCLKLPDSDMLCDGHRLFVDYEASSRYGVLKTSVGCCFKREALAVKEKSLRLLEQSGIPERFYSDRDFTHTGWVRDNRGRITHPEYGLLPSLFKMVHSPESKDYICNLGVDLGLSGFSVKIALMSSLISEAGVWYSLPEIFGDALDFFAIMRYDVGSLPDFKLSALLSLLEQRDDNIRMATVISTSVSQAYRSYEEKEWLEKVPVITP